jgi:hypothetical protein
MYLCRGCEGFIFDNTTEANWFFQYLIVVVVVVQQLPVNVTAFFFNCSCRSGDSTMVDFKMMTTVVCVVF